MLREFTELVIHYSLGFLVIMEGPEVDRNDRLNTYILPLSKIKRTSTKQLQKRYRKLKNALNKQLFNTVTTILKNGNVKCN